tara:strand:+ start:22 stop:297 length:276 start_codon:yes stop_codon:yes gene_type:complete
MVTPLLGEPVVSCQSVAEPPRAVNVIDVAEGSVYAVIVASTPAEVVSLILISVVARYGNVNEYVVVDPLPVKVFDVVAIMLCVFLLIYSYL